MKNKTYDQLLERLENIFHIDSACRLLDWDEQVNLPPGAADARARQLAVMSEILHQTATDPGIDGLLKTLGKEKAALSDDQKLVLKEATKEYRRITRIPPEFVKRKAFAQSKSYHAWAKARESNDFAAFAPFLQEQIDLTREEAGYVGEGDAVYDYCIDRHDPEMKASIIEELFTRLKKDLIPLVHTIIDSPVKPDFSIFKGFPIDRQEAFLRTVVRKLGFDFNHGRIDRSLHPFCGGIGADVRMTTRFDEDNPIDSLSSVIHETGHGLYEQGLPRDHPGTALAEAIGMAVHESQSRLWENQVGRSRAFWNFYEPKYREAFQSQLKDVSSDALFLAINGVRRQPIRVDSDEVTYNLHIILRFELEKKLFDKTLAVNDLPDAWNQLSQEIIGLKPRNDTEGVLQDIHWCSGYFGYFPSYCLGNMLAAQLWYTSLDALPNLESEIEQGNFAPLLDWLREHIHQHGKRYNTLELTQRVTGKPLGPDALIHYLKERYLPLYS